MVNEMLTGEGEGLHYSWLEHQVLEFLACSPHESSDMRDFHPSPDVAALIRATMASHAR